MIVEKTQRARLQLLICVTSMMLAACVNGVQSVDPVTETKAWSVDAQKNRDLMVGKWLGESKNRKGNLRLSLIERNENGTYRITFRMYQDDRDYEESVEVGLWGISGQTYFTIMRGWMIDGKFEPSDSTRAYYYDAYRISSLSAVSFEYESLETGNRFSNRRVGDDFRFSD